MAGGEGFSDRDKSGADTSSACSVRDDQDCDSAPGAAAFEERTDMDGDDAVEIALDLGHVAALAESSTQVWIRAAVVA